MPEKNNNTYNSGHATVVYKQPKGKKCVGIAKEELKIAPLKTNDATNPDSNNGLITSIWGPHEWESFHAKTFGYPIKPDNETKQRYLNYFVSLGDVLPCKYCRDSYKEFIKKEPTMLNLDTMESRETLTRWGMALHDAVNNKLGVDYGVTYEELCYKFESYRAKCTKKENGCKMPLDDKAESYKKADIYRAPLLDKKTCLAFEQYAVNAFGFKYFGDCVRKYSNIDRNSQEWAERDCFARKLIRYMRKNGIRPLTENNMPSYHETILLSVLSTTIDKRILEDIFKKCS